MRSHRQRALACDSAVGPLPTVHTPAGELITLDEFKAKVKTDRAMWLAKSKLTGIKCPKCEKELLYLKKLGSGTQPTRKVKCSCCDYKGEVVNCSPNAIEL